MTEGDFSLFTVRVVEFDYLSNQSWCSSSIEESQHREYSLADEHSNFRKAC